MYLTYFNTSNITQYSIIDQSRTTEGEGTWVLDLQR